MNTIVAMKQVPDLQHLRIRNREPVLAGIPTTFGKIDKNALEAAVRLREAHGGEVIVVSAGNEQLEDTIKEAMAAGGDRAYLLIDDEIDKLDSENVANILAELIKRQGDYGLILFGEGSGDNYSGQVGPRVAHLLGLPQIGYVTEIEVTDNQARVKRSLEDRDEILDVALPCVLTVAAGLNEPRLPTVSQVLKASSKPKEILELADMGLDLVGNKT